MFVGEAPGRLGADQTAIPFHGDNTGNNFERLLQDAGLDRNAVFVTNAVLCNPKDGLGNNATPGHTEIRNCSSFLRQQIDLVDPRIVVGLGQTALSALSLVDHHSLVLGRDVATLTPWYGRLLMPLYHPGPRAMIHRSYQLQLEDYVQLASQISPARYEMLATDLVKLILSRVTAPISYFALHKLFYIAEVKFSRRYGRRLTNAYIIRQADGPYVTNLHIKKLRKTIPKAQVLTRAGKLCIGSGQSRLLEMFQEEKHPESAMLGYVIETLDEYIGKSDSQLKTIAYLTRPMRHVLALEKATGAILNRPIVFT